jgi:signal transduction histidine kinase
MASAERMGTMVNQLLDLTRVRLGGGIAIRTRPTDLAEVATTIVEELRLANPASEIRCSLSSTRGEWDADRLSQVFSNLVANALQHGDPSRAVEVRLAPADGGATFEVRNFGETIPPETIPFIFDAYRRGRAERTGQGLGLGLFISRQIVLAHAGRIEVSSSPESGTLFRVLLPSCTAGPVANADRAPPR